MINKICVYVDILEFEGYVVCLNFWLGGVGKGEGWLDICLLIFYIKNCFLMFFIIFLFVENI